MSGPSAAGGAVLVVDDTPTNLRLVSDVLADAGFEVAVARSGEEALARLEVYRPDVVLLDVMMPGLDGFETCRRMKASAAWADIPVIFMTALGDVESKLAGFAAGAVDYVTKPFDVREVVARARTQVTLRRLERELVDRNAALARTNAELQEALASVRTLSGLLPICAHCKKIKDDEGSWRRVEDYVAARTEAEFTHGICPACLERHFPGA